MAYGQKYSVILYTQEPEVDGSCLLSIQEEGYVGAVDTSLKIDFDSVVLTRDFDNWDSRIIGMSLEFDIRNDKSNFYELRNLMFAKEKKYFIRLTHIKNLVSTILFEGYINTDVVEQKYLNYQAIRIVASSYISRLEHFQPASIEDLENKPFINIILECLNAVNQNYPVWVNTVGISPVEETISAPHTILNKTGIYTEVFWKNNVERMNSLQILSSILEAFDLYMYWLSGKWVIEHFSALCDTVKNFVVYQQNTEYSPTIGGTTSSVSYVARDLHSLIFTRMSQTMIANPGVRQITVKLNEFQKFLNFTSNYFVEALPTTTPAPEVKLRGWEYYDGYPEVSWNKGFFGNGVSYKTIKNAMLRGHSNPLMYAEGGWYHTRLTRGLYTRIKYRVVEDSKLLIRFKYAFDKSTFKVYAKDSPSGSILSYPFRAFSDYKWCFFWNIYADPLPDYPSNSKIAIRYDNDNDTWSMVNCSVPVTAGNENDYRNRVYVDGASFDAINNTVEVSITIPVGEILQSIGYGEYSFILSIGSETVVGETLWGFHEKYKTPQEITYWGDVIIESDEPNVNEANLFEGSINEDYLNKEEIEIDIADIKSTNYKNAILRGDVLEERTTTWTHPKEGQAHTLIEWLFYYRFRQKNLPRICVKGNVFERGILPLFTPFFDSMDPDLPNRKFLLVAYRYKPVTQSYDDLTLLEYDDSTEVILAIE